MLERTEPARVEKQDGCVVGPYKAMFAGNTILILDPQADVEEGDTVLRQLPNGKDERSVVTNANFYSEGPGSFGAHYQLKFRKGPPMASKPAQNINITGAQSVQIGDYNTQNIVNSFEALIKQIESSNATTQEKAEARSLLGAFLKHPAVVALLGAAATALVG